MRTQRTIMLIALGVAAAGMVVLAGLVVWLGWAVGVLVAVAATAALVGVYLALIRPWHMRWGATDAEVERPMPGDDLVLTGAVSTRAISIDAEPADVWPWLVQIGFGKAGWYSYDWIDNDGIESAHRILPEFQDIEIGDRIEIIPDMGPAVVSIDPDHALVAADDDGTSSWCLEVFRDGDHTRLISRWRNNWAVTPATALMIALTDPGAFIMEQKMLREIRRRVEAR